MRTALAVAHYRVRDTRLTLGIAAVLLAVAAFGTHSLSTSVGAATPPALVDRMRPVTWAMTIPASWLAAPAPHARFGDAFDLIAIRTTDRAVAVPVAYAVVLLASDDRGLTLQVDEDDAVAIANARGSGMQLIALLRSAR